MIDTVGVTWAPITVIITPDVIDPLFAKHATQGDVFLAIYKFVYPEWDKIESIDGWPKVGKELSKYLMGKFIEFDKVHHPEVVAGGLWLNKGFSTLDNEDVHPWGVIAAPCVYKEST